MNTTTPLSPYAYWANFEARFPAKAKLACDMCEALLRNEEVARCLRRYIQDYDTLMDLRAEMDAVPGRVFFDAIDAPEEQHDWLWDDIRGMWGIGTMPAERFIGRMLRTISFGPGPYDDEQGGQS